VSPPGVPCLTFMRCLISTSRRYGHRALPSRHPCWQLRHDLTLIALALSRSCGVSRRIFLMAERERKKLGAWFPSAQVLKAAKLPETDHCSISKS
jgi:hypothetical protein